MSIVFVLRIYDRLWPSSFQYMNESGRDASNICIGKIFLLREFKNVSTHTISLSNLFFSLLSCHLSLFSTLQEVLFMCVYVYRFLIVLMISVKKQEFNPI